MDATYQPLAPSRTGPGTGPRPPRITCLAPEYVVAEGLATELRRLLPDARVESASLAMIAHADAPDCVVALAGADASATVDTIAQFRAQGGNGGIVLVVDDPATVDVSLVAMLGIDAVLAAQRMDIELLPALHRVFTAPSLVTRDAGALARYLTRCHALLAAGLSVTRLPHRLNNPLAALLAEAELLRLDALTTEQRESVDRILEISQRLIAEVRQLEGMSGGPA